MKKKLFLICPDCQIEHFLKEKYGDNIYFLTALGAVFKLNQISYAEAVVEFLKREAITEVFIVNDISCRFIDTIIKKEKGFGTHAENVLFNLLIDNYSAIMNKPTLMEKKKKMAELNIEQQFRELLLNGFFLNIRSDIRLKGLISSKAEGKVIELNFKNFVNEFGSLNR